MASSTVPIGVAVSAPSSFLSNRRISVRFSEFRGLKIKPRLASLTQSTRSAIQDRRRVGRVVCEAQNTAVDVPAIKDETWQSLVLECELPVLVEFWAPWWRTLPYDPPHNRRAVEAICWEAQMLQS
ncbi:hypothetical protein ES288_1Z032600v1 [Gossypium darwinii]|uniref:Thioredoxin domain-containing protein n=1 Tax=Gossypium darwinii TaxID=34276 RepID=A0A5C7IZA0_GOSDA|nr:hypothetical protein ES288_1Z032600v1 [Gossypium darwinii]TXG74570.1 hypothetical protein ES288_1Z032600v1 [Gossypium darwinii]